MSHKSSGQSLHYNNAPMATPQFVVEEAQLCRQSFEKCLTIPSLMKYDWVKNRFADFKLWCSGLGTFARDKASLDWRLRDRPLIREVVVNLLQMLHSFLDECEHTHNVLGKRKLRDDENYCDDGASPDTSHIFSAIEDVLHRLAWISVAIRQSGSTARADRADLSFDSKDYSKLRRHLECVLRKKEVVLESKEGFPKGVYDATGSLTNIQRRLIDTNLRRRHRFRYAKRHAQSLSAHQRQNPGGIPSANPAVLQPKQVTDLIVQVEASERAANASPNESVDLGRSTIATEPSGSLIIPHQDVERSTTTAVSTTGAKLDYPRPPIIGQIATIRCPCCCQTLPIEVADEPSGRWRKHIQEDLCPYTCILDGCETPSAMYTTQKAWQAHMNEQHTPQEVLICILCKEDKPLNHQKLDREMLEAHLRSVHNGAITESQIPTVIGMSAQKSYVHECPICYEKYRFISHVANCIHAFAMRALPWATGRNLSRASISHDCFENLKDWFKSLPGGTVPDELAVGWEVYPQIVRTDPVSSEMTDSEDEDDYFGHEGYFQSVKKEYESDMELSQGSLSDLSMDSSSTDHRQPVYDSRLPLEQSTQPMETEDPGDPVFPKFSPGTPSGIERCISTEHFIREVQDLIEYLNDNQACGRSSPNRDTVTHFVPISRVHAYFENDQRTRLLLRALAQPGTVPLPNHVICQEHSYRRVLCILVRMGQGQLIQRFTEHEFLCDQYLPFTTKPHMFPLGPDLFEEFQAKQWEFCAANITRRYNVTLDPKQILPFVECEQQKQGGSSTIYKIRVHEDYDLLWPKRSSISILVNGNQDNDAQNHVYALKAYNTFDDAAPHYYRNETDAFARLQRVDAGESHIVEFYQGFVHCGTYNLILEYASWGTLEDFFQRVHPPTARDDIIEIWQSLLIGLLTALVRLHESESCYGWHQDIKPSNILVMGVKSDSPWKWNFKVADFGLSHFKQAIANGFIQPPLGRDTWGSADYVAPEAARPNEFALRTNVMVTQKIDVWSMGCLFSEAAAWMMASFEGVKEYRTKRCLATEAMTHVEAKGCFHDNKRILNVVKQQHSLIRDEMARRDDQLTPTVVEKMVEVMLRSSANNRPTALGAYNIADEIICRAAQGLERSEGSLNSSCVYVTPDTQENPGPRDSKVNCSRSISREPSIDLSPLPIRQSRALPVLKVAEAWNKVIEQNRKLADLDHGTMLNDLRGRDHVFLLDDSVTMRQYWPSLKILCLLLFQIVKDYDPDSVDLHFTVSQTQKRSFKTRKSLAAFLARQDPQLGPCNMSNRLGLILQAYQDRLRRRDHLTSVFRRKVRPISIYILTDGRWELSPDISDVIKNLVDQMGKLMVAKEQVGLQFISWGNDPEVQKRLERLDSGLGTRLDVVDTERADGNVLKMLLGSINQLFDNDTVRS